jgi:lysozyme
MNAAGIALIKDFEGCELAAYQDTGGIWTIGVGHTPAEPGQTITEDQADALLQGDVSYAEIAVKAAIRVVTNDNQLAAMTSLAFNIGVGAFRASSVLRRHNEANFPAAADAFLLWDKAHVDGQLLVLGGLLRRRQVERALYLTTIPVG